MVIQYFNRGGYRLRRHPPLNILDAHPLWHHRRWAKQKISSFILYLADPFLVPLWIPPISTTWVTVLSWHIRQNACLTAHNWQKWKRVFLTCPCIEIYRDEAVGLKSCKYTWKITIYVNMWNLGQFLEKSIFCQ